MMSMVGVLIAVICLRCMYVCMYLHNFVYPYPCWLTSSSSQIQRIHLIPTHECTGGLLCVCVLMAFCVHMLGFQPLPTCYTLPNVMLLAVL